MSRKLCRCTAVSDLRRLVAFLLALQRATAVLERMTGGHAASKAPQDDWNGTCSFEFSERSAAESGRVSDNQVQAEMCGLSAAKQFYNQYCDTLPLVEPSAGCRAVQLSDIQSWMPSEPRTLWLWGDSVMRQVWHNTLCLLTHVVPPEDIERDKTNQKLVGKNVKPQSEKKKKMEKKPGVVPWINWGQKGVGGKLLQPPLKWSPRLSSLSCKPMYGCIRFGNLNICYGDTWKDSGFHNTRTVSCFINSKPTDVHVMNYGMWHNDRRGVPVATAALVKFLKAVAAHRGDDAMPHMVWFETTPQHFLSKGGLFTSKKGSIQKGCMKEAPLEEMRSLEFRNRLTLPMLNSSSLQEVAPMHVFRTWELLAPHPKLHGQKYQDKVDCVHWCETDGSGIAALAKILLSDLSRVFWDTFSGEIR